MGRLSHLPRKDNEPEEITATTLYLASDQSAMVTGSALLIDGECSAGK